MKITIYIYIYNVGNNSKNNRKNNNVYNEIVLRKKIWYVYNKFVILDNNIQNCETLMPKW